MVVWVLFPGMLAKPVLQILQYPPVLVYLWVLGIVRELPVGYSLYGRYNPMEVLVRPGHYILPELPTHTFITIDS